MVSGKLASGVGRLLLIALAIGGCERSTIGGVSTTGAGTGAGASSGAGAGTGTGASGVVNPVTGMGGGIATGGSTSVVTGLGGTTGISSCSLGGFGGAGMVMSRSMMPPQFGVNVAQAVPPPAVSGGTLRVLADGLTAVAADPDRDQVYVVDLASRTLRATITLTAGDEPGRVIQDGAGRVHVALRRGGAVISIDPAAGQLLDRRPVCAAPRGLAYQATGDLLHVACSDGELVSLPAAGGAATRTLRLDRDLRDVVVDGARLRVSRFKSAQLLTVEADGTVSARITPPEFKSVSARPGQLFTAGVAWRTMALPDGGVMMLHQRGVIEPITPSPGGYGSTDPCSSIVHPTVTTVTADGIVRTGAALAGLVLAVDAAVSTDGTRVAFVAMGNATNGQTISPTGTMTPSRVFVTEMGAINDSAVGCRPDGISGPCGNPRAGVAGTSGTSSRADGGVDAGAGGTGGGGVDAGAGGAAGWATGSVDAGAGGAAGWATGSVDAGAGGTGGAVIGGFGGGNVPCMPNPNPIPTVVGEPIAIAFAGDGSLVVQSREPAMLAFASGVNVTLSPASRADTGHQVFHANAGGGIACATCHAEGDDDGRVWNFVCAGSAGARRTQSLLTGLRGTEPFHWSGDEANLDALMKDVFNGRMSGPPLSSEQVNLLLNWIDGQPRPGRAVPTDPAAVTRGRALFNDTQSVGCVTCHSGDRFSNNQSVDVGTGAMFQVPSLLRIGTRGPFMHNGCASTLRDRFTPACGGTKHGTVDHLSAAQLSDLIAFLESI